MSYPLLLIRKRFFWFPFDLKNPSLATLFSRHPKVLLRYFFTRCSCFPFRPRSSSAGTTYVRTLCEVWIFFFNKKKEKKNNLQKTQTDMFWALLFFPQRPLRDVAFKPGQIGFTFSKLPKQTTLHFFSDFAYSWRLNVIRQTEQLNRIIYLSVSLDVRV